MSQSQTVEAARAGNLKAIAHLLNQSLSKNRIKANVTLHNGLLEIVLDSSSSPDESVGLYILQGLQKLKIVPAYEVSIYGRKAGETFATWSRHFQLKPRPDDDPALFFNHHHNRSSVVDLPNSDVALYIRGKFFEIGVDQVLIYGGVALLLLGIFCPIVSFPIYGTLNFFRDGHPEAIALISLAVTSAVLFYKKLYSWVYGTSLLSLFIVGGTFYYIVSTIQDTKSSLDSELAGNPFRGLADLAADSIRLQWGWIFLFIGAGFVLWATYRQKPRMDRDAFVSIGVSLAGVIAIIFSQSPILQTPDFGGEYSSRAAQESTAKNYIGAINRGQQAYWMENEAFTSDIHDLGLGLKEETEDYTIDIVDAGPSYALVKATAKSRGLSSFSGGTFLSDDNTLSTIMCESNRATQTPVGEPFIGKSGAPECPSGTSES